MITLLLSLLLSSPSRAAPATCEDAIQASLKDWGPKTKIEVKNLIPVPDQNLFEVVAFVYSWVPNSETNSGFYLLVTATCEPLPGVKKPKRLDQMVPWDFASEGGVQVKVVSKAR